MVDEPMIAKVASDVWQPEDSPSLPTEDRTVSASEDALLRVLAMKLEESKTALSVALTAFTLFLAINAAMLKTALDASDPRTKFTMTALGVATAALYVVVAWFKNRVRDYLLSDIVVLTHALKLSIATNQVVGLKYVSWTTGAFAVFMVMFWLLQAFVGFTSAGGPN